MRKIKLLMPLLTIAPVAAVCSCNKQTPTKETFLSIYSNYLNNYLKSTKMFSIEPVGEYANMEYRDQIIDNIILTTFSVYPNQHYLKINTQSQRRFNFCAAGRSVEDVTKLVNDLYSDAKQDTVETTYKLKETFSFTESSISYVIEGESEQEEIKTILLGELRINSFGYIEKFTNTTAGPHASEEYGCFELKYTEK